MTLTIEDRVGIADLLNRIYRQMDEGDVHAYAAAFTLDGTVENPFLTMRGRAEIIQRLEAVIEPGEPTEQHWLGDISIAETDDGALARGYMLVLEGTNGSVAPSLTAAYRMTWTLIREDGDWLVRSLVAAR